MDKLPVRIIEHISHHYDSIKDKHNEVMAQIN